LLITHGECKQHDRQSCCFSHNVADFSNDEKKTYEESLKKIARVEVLNQRRALLDAWDKIKIDREIERWEMKVWCEKWGLR
jgi:hypothetical protein